MKRIQRNQIQLQSEALEQEARRRGLVQTTNVFDPNDRSFYGPVSLFVFWLPIGFLLFAIFKVGEAVYGAPLIIMGILAALTYAVVFAPLAILDSMLSVAWRIRLWKAGISWGAARKAEKQVQQFFSIRTTGVSYAAWLFFLSLSYIAITTILVLILPGVGIEEIRYALGQGLFLAFLFPAVLAHIFILALPVLGVLQFNRLRTRQELRSLAYGWGR